MKFMWYLIKKYWKTWLYALLGVAIGLLAMILLTLVAVALSYYKTLQIVTTVVIGIIVLLFVGVIIAILIDILIKNHREYKEMKDEIR